MEDANPKTVAGATVKTGQFPTFNTRKNGDPEAAAAGTDGFRD
jgi:hypothetical protein